MSTLRFILRVLTAFMRSFVLLPQERPYRVHYNDRNNEIQSERNDKQTREGSFRI